MTPHPPKNNGKLIQCGVALHRVKSPDAYIAKVDPILKDPFRKHQQ